MPNHALAASRLALAMLSTVCVATVASANAIDTTTASETLSEDNAAAFLGRLMRAESGGRDRAANPRSSALGAFQFIRSTFLDVARRNFPDEVDDLNEKQILALRTDRTFAWRAALAYTNENATFLAERGIEPTLSRLRLAFLLGPAGAVRLVQAPAEQPVSRVFDRAVLRANPFMRRMTATELIAKAEREMSEPAPATAAKPGSPPEAAAPASKLRCRPQLASCRRAMALERRRREARQGGAPTS